MILLENTLISEDILENEFVCNISKCKGACCEIGDAGAPLTREEVALIEQALPVVKPLMTEAGLQVLDERGFVERDTDGELVTTTVGGRECLFAKKESNGTWTCTIEEAHLAGKTEFRKPISCHLYPIREIRTGTITGLNYDRWDICSDACSLGQELQVPVYKFTREALIRRFGEDWYQELENLAEDYFAAQEAAKE